MQHIASIDLTPSISYMVSHVAYSRSAPQPKILGGKRDHTTRWFPSAQLNQGIKQHGYQNPYQ
jgi:hypothetical protein